MSDAEKALLEKYLWFYRSLAHGIRSPSTPAQKRFVAVVMGHAAPETPHEIAYMKYERIQEQERAERESGEVRDPELDGPTADWFTRDDWKKLRGRQQWDGRRD